VWFDLIFFAYGLIRFGLEMENDGWFGLGLASHGNLGWCGFGLGLKPLAGWAPIHSRPVRLGAVHQSPSKHGDADQSLMNPSHTDRLPLLQLKLHMISYLTGHFKDFK
jgi:hypothetical protein